MPVGRNYTEIFRWCYTAEDRIYVLNKMLDKAGMKGRKMSQKMYLNLLYQKSFNFLHLISTLSLYEGVLIGCKKFNDFF